MIVHVDRRVDPPNDSASSENQNTKYRTRWQAQAERAISKQKEGKYLDRRERRLTQSFKLWQSLNQQGEAA